MAHFTFTLLSASACSCFCLPVADPGLSESKHDAVDWFSVHELCVSVRVWFRGVSRVRYLSAHHFRRCGVVANVTVRSNYVAVERGGRQCVAASRRRADSYPPRSLPAPGRADGPPGTLPARRKFTRRLRRRRRIIHLINPDATGRAPPQQYCAYNRPTTTDVCGSVQVAGAEDLAPLRPTAWRTDARKVGSAAKPQFCP